jgi:hypothetical protein
VVFIEAEIYHRLKKWIDGPDSLGNANVQSSLTCEFEVEANRDENEELVRSGRDQN